MGRSDKKSTKTSPASSSLQDIVPAAKTNRIPAIYLEQLTALWEADKRLPSADSRRAWSLARAIEPPRVNSWWYRKKTTAKKHGVSFPEGTYELPIGTVPKPPSSSGSGTVSSRRIGLGIHLGDIKNEESQVESKFKVALLDDDPALGLNPVSSGSSDILGSLDSDDYQQTSTGSPNAPAGTAFCTSNGCRNPAEMYNTMTIGAYNHSMATNSTSWDGFHKPVDFGGGYMPSHKSQFGTFHYDTVATEKQALLYKPGGYEQASYDSVVGSLYTPPNVLVCNQGDAQRFDFACSPCLPVCSGEGTIRAWDDIEENGHNKLQLVLPEPCQKHDSPTAMQDPANFSWCLGGKRYSPDGFFLGLCECFGFPEVFLFKRFAGCTGPWEEWSISELDAGDSDT